MVFFLFSFHMIYYCIIAYALFILIFIKASLLDIEYIDII